MTGRCDQHDGVGRLQRLTNSSVPVARARLQALSVDPDLQAVRLKVGNQTLHEGSVCPCIGDEHLITARYALCEQLLDDQREVLLGFPAHL